MRGRLIFPFLAEVCRLDLATTEYDLDFKESVVDGIGEPMRVESPPVLVPCQVETKRFDELRMLPGGQSPRSRVDLVFHFRDLERRGLVGPTGEAQIRLGDRLSAIFDRTGALVQRIRTPPGLYATEVRPLGFGLGRRWPRRNLLLVTFEDRQQGTRRG